MGVKGLLLEQIWIRRVLSGFVCLAILNNESAIGISLDSEIEMDLSLDQVSEVPLGPPVGGGTLGTPFIAIFIGFPNLAMLVRALIFVARHAILGNGTRIRSSLPRLRLNRLLIQSLKGVRCHSCERGRLVTYM